MFLSTLAWELPITDPVLKFLIILIIILFSPILLERIKVPPLLGLIIAGAIIGPHGFNLILRDSGIIMSGTAGLLYIMFLAGLEIDIADFKKNSWKSLVFGIYTFCIPMVLGFLVSFYIFQYDMLASTLLASMLASHTLIAYVIISKFGLSQDPAVSITVGGTMITDTLALLVLTIIVGMDAGEVDKAFWIRLCISILVFIMLVLFVFPPLCRSFFKKYNDSISQYIFVLALVFLGAFIAELAGIESIIGAFISGLALNRLIPRNSPLMSRVEFVGNAIFIPFFLISVGMLIDYRAFFTSWETIKVGVLMTLTATVAKYAAAVLTQKTFRFSKDQRRLIFGLSNAQAAATLAAVMVGYNVGILNDAVLNGTILMILVTCTMASLCAQKGAHNIVANRNKEIRLENTEEKEIQTQKILVALGSDSIISEQVNFALSIKIKNKENDNLYCAKIVDTDITDENTTKDYKRQLERATKIAAATDTEMKSILRFDLNINNSISSIINEIGITDLIYGQSIKREINNSEFKKLYECITMNPWCNAFIYRPIQPLSTIMRHMIILPDMAQMEKGFPGLINRLIMLMKNTGSKAVIYGEERTLSYIRDYMGKSSGLFLYIELNNWEYLSEIGEGLKHNDMLWIVLSRKGGISHNSYMPSIASIVSKYTTDKNCVLVYPEQIGIDQGTKYYT